MKIAEIKSFLMQAEAPSDDAWASDPDGHQRPARNWLFVKVVTDTGIWGVGECSGWPRAAQVAVHDLESVLIGEDPRNIERLWHKMYCAQMGHGMTGTVGSGAIAGLDMALWDIKGKALETPVWNLLGGLVRPRVKYYSHASDAKVARQLVSKGVAAVKTGGVKQPLRKVREIRAAVGQSVDVMVDLHGPPWLTVKDAIGLGHALEDFHLLFIEDPAPPEDIEGLERIARAVRTPIAAGERVGTIWGWRPLLERRIADVIQPDTGRAGITQMRKLAAMAEAFGVVLAPHSGSLGPVAEFAAVHVMAAIPNALILERVENDWPVRDRLIDVTLESEGGYLGVPTAPGLGVDIDEDLVSQYPSITNVAMAQGGYSEGTEDECVYVQARTSRARYFAPQ